MPQSALICGVSNLKAFLTAYMAVEGVYATFSNGIEISVGIGRWDIKSYEITDLMLLFAF